MSVRLVAKKEKTASAEASTVLAGLKLFQSAVSNALVDAKRALESGDECKPSL
jgi:hypothetical protein